MAVSKFQAGLGVILVAGAITLFLQYRTQQQLHQENESLRQQFAQLQAERQEAPATDSKPASSAEFNELLRLRGEVGGLRAQTNQLAKLQAQNQQLREAFTNVAQQKQQAPDPAEEQQRAFAILQISTARQSVMGMLMYASDHNNEFPTNLDLAAPYFEDKSSAEFTNLNRMELIYQGTLANIANPSSAIVVRGIQPWMSHGKWANAYGFADGHAEVRSDPTGNFTDWEQQHAPVLKNQ